MEIQALKVVMTEDEANALLRELQPKDSPVENVRVRLAPQGVTVLGDYPVMMMKMAFELLWEVSGGGSLVQAKLASVKVAGLPGGMLRGMIFKAIREAAAKEPAVEVQDDLIRVNLAELPATKRLHLRLHLTAVRCEAGRLVIEAGPPPA